jgi:hypothetical protein
MIELQLVPVFAVAGDGRMFVDVRVPVFVRVLARWLGTGGCLGAHGGL